MLLDRLISIVKLKLLIIDQNIKLVCYCTLIALSSNVGQTFFIGLFSEQIIDRFQISHLEFSQLFSIATMLSAVTLYWTGKKLDSLDLYRGTNLILLGVASSCLLMGIAESVTVLGFALFLLRQFGQGLMTQTASSTIVRYMFDNRGLGLSLSHTGFAIGEAILPIIVIILLSQWGWQISWTIIGLMVVLVIFPFSLYCLQGVATNQAPIARKNNKIPEPNNEKQQSSRVAQKHWTRREVMKDKYFYMVLPNMLMPAFVCTGLFFHQLFIAEQMKWSLGTLGSSYVFYAACQLISLIFTGPIIDRVGAIKLLPVITILVLSVLLILMLEPHQHLIWIYMGLLGLTIGVSLPTIFAYWAEVYGTQHIGSIKSVVISGTVLASSAAPVIYGYLIDRFATLTYLIGPSIALVCIGGLFSVIASHHTGKRLSLQS